MNYVLSFMLLTSFALFSQQDKQSVCPMHEKPGQKAADDDHHRDVDERGDAVMGFSHEKTTHHFLLYADGGAIVAESKDPKDAESQSQIRAHFQHIAGMFADGNFTAPLLVHGKNPPGTERMKRLQGEIHYQFETTERGGRVQITTANARALSAIHEFLRFQIKDHRTGDPLTISPKP